MAELDEKLAAMMADPNIMAQVAAMAKSLGMAPPGPGETPPEGPPKPPEGPPKPPEGPPKPPPKGPEKSPAPPPSPDVLQRLAAMAGQSALDENRRRLLHALRPYVRPERLARLENAMRTAQLAGAATAMLEGGGHV